MRKLERMMTAILTSVLAIISEPKRIFGSSSKLNDPFQGLPCFVFRYVDILERERE
jgi:hypothetical protein